jgi:tight adherence protein C
MTAALIIGGVVGAGVFLLVIALTPRRVSLSKQIAAFDAERAQRTAQPSSYPGDGKESELSRRLGRWLVQFCAEQGWEFPSLRANLSLVGKSFENFLATKVLLAVFGFLIVPVIYLMLSFIGLHLPALIPVWVALIFATVFFFLPDLELRQQADRRRRDFRHAVGVFLDLVSMNLSGGRGVPEALMAASEVGGGWSMWRIRDALSNARITGQTPWQALGALGEDVRVDELRDLSAALSLVADDGAKVRESLTARAASLRRREIAELEGQAGEKSQSMLVAQMLMCAAFMLFLLFPAAIAMLGA